MCSRRVAVEARDSKVPVEPRWVDAVPVVALNRAEPDMERAVREPLARGWGVK